MFISHSPSSHRSTSGESTPEVCITTGLNGTELEAARFYYQNVRGLRTKIDDLYVATIDCTFDVIVLTETGLNDAINSVQLFGNSYDVYRCDRSRRNSNKCSFGGVLIAVRRIHSSFVIETSSGADLEQISVSANIYGKSFKICAVYIPPDRSRTSGVLESHIATVREICESATNGESVIALGDYNQPHLLWNLHPVDGTQLVVTSLLSAASSCLVDGMCFLNLNQRNLIRNHLNRTLDLVFSDLLLDITRSSEALLPIDQHHPPLAFDVPVIVASMQQTRRHPARPPLNFRKINFERLSEHLLNTHWDDVLRNEPVDTMTELFCNVINRWLLSNVPRVKPATSPAWSTPLLKALRRQKNAAQRRLRRCRTDDTQFDFRRACRAYRTLNAALYKTHVQRMQSSLRVNPRLFWNFVNSKRRSNEIPTNVHFEGCVAEAYSTGCELFADHFQHVFSDTVASDAECVEACRAVPADLVDLGTFSIDCDMVKTAINKVKNSFSPGPDGIPSVVYRRCADAVIHPLARIFNKSFAQRKFPELWKMSYMFPVFKSGDKHDVKQYRGITNLSAGSKIFETIVSKALLRSAFHYIAPEQHGFVPGRSVCTNLLEYTSFCVNQIENGSQVDAIYTDIKAAFDRIDHRILIAKLSRLGLHENIVNWLWSYLSGRCVRVKLGDCISRSFSNLSGVPQGSNLGPLLFVLFFNDAILGLSDKCKIVYADDLKLYLAIGTPDDCNALQWEVNKFAKWCHTNKLTISVPKCSVISFYRTKSPILHAYHIDGMQLKRVREVDDLGVTLDTQLTFNVHRSNVIAKANRLLGFVAKIARDFTDPHCLKSLYCALVRPLLEQALVVWAPYQLNWTLRLERVQKRFLRIALRRLNWRHPESLPPYADRCQLLGLDTLQRRRKIQQASFVVKLLNGDIASPNLLSLIELNAPMRVLRHHSLLRLRRHRTAYGYNEPVTAMIRTFQRVEDLHHFGETSKKFIFRVQHSNRFK